MSAYFKGRGKIYVATRNPFQDNEGDGFVAAANAMEPVGNVSEFKIEASISRDKVFNFMDGKDSTDLSLASEFGMRLSLTAEEASHQNIALALYGGVRTVKGESVSNAYFAVKDPATRKWSNYKTATALPKNVRVKVARRIFSGGLSIDNYTYFDYSSVVIHDSSVVPKILVSGTHYTPYSVSGEFVFSAFPAGCTFPLRASFDCTRTLDRIASPIDYGRPYMLSHQNIERCLVKDSAAPSYVTITPDLYDLDAAAGMITFVSESGVEALDPVYPLIVDAAYGESEQVILGTDVGTELWLRFVGKNSVDGRDYMVDLYRVSFDPASFEVITKATSKIPLAGEIMQDSSMPDNGPMGKLGRIVRV